MSKVLIMLTMTYPYDTGNNFLTNEYLAINENYDRVIVLCMAAPQHSKIGHKLSDKWEVFKRIDTKNEKIRKIRYVLAGLYHIFNQELQNEIKKTPKLLNKVIAIYYYGRLMQFQNFIENIVPKLSLKRENKIIIYSFWFLQTANCAITLKHNLQSKIGCDVLSISRAHGYDLYEYRNRANYLPFREVIIKGLDKIFPCSKNGVKYLTERNCEYDSKISCSYLGTVDHGLNLECPNKYFIIITCSNINAVKRLKLVVEALIVLEQKKCTDVQWLCIGDGPLETEIRELCSKKLKKIKVVFFGRLSNEKVFELYRKQHIDIFLNVSSSEGLPVSIMEAQSQGIPVVATNVGGTSEIINNDNGILLSANPSPQELAYAILHIKNMFQEKVKLLRINSRKNWERNFNAIQNYQQFHKSLINQIDLGSIHIFSQK